MHRPLIVVGLLLLGAAAAAVPPPPSATVEPRPAATEWRLEREGIAVELEIAPLAGGGLREGEVADFRFAIADAATGQAFSGLYPAAWMALLEEDEELTPGSCVQRVEEFVGGSILHRAELDLNVYYVLALNDDASISVVDPLFGFGGTKLLAMIELPAPGEDWVLSSDGERLFVSVPDAGQVVVADTRSWKLLAPPIDVGARPRRLAIQPDGAYLWVTADGEGEREGTVAVVDLAERRLRARLATGPGPHEIAFSGDSRYAFVAHRGTGTVTAIDVHRLEPVAEVATGEEPASIAYSPMADAVYVTHAGDGTIVAVDARSHRVIARLTAAPGLGQIRFAPGGRFGFAVNPVTNLVHIVDAAKNRIVQTGDLKAGPDQVAFSDELAFIRHRDSEIVLMIPLDEIGEEGTIVPVIDFPGGQLPFGRGRLPSPAPAIVQAPGANAVLVANPADEAIYYYKEGMAAPMGAFSNYDRQPRAVLVIDRSLRERRASGRYETTAALRRPGRYAVAFFLDSPRIIHCFETRVEPSPELEAARRAALPAVVEPLFSSGEVPVGESVRLRFRLTDPNTGEPETGLRDVTVMAYNSANWQRRQPASEVEAGIYEATFTAPATGSYRVLVQCPSRRLAFHRSPVVMLRAVADPGKRERAYRDASPTP